MSDRDNPVAQFVDAYIRAVFDKDVDAFMRLYDAQVRVFDTWGAWSYEGGDAFRTVVERWFGSLGDERVKVSVDDLQVIDGNGLMSASAFFKYVGLSADGQPLRGMQNRLTWTLQRDGDNWKIVHEHTSAPIGFEDGKAILQRPKPPTPA